MADRLLTRIRHRFAAGFAQGCVRAVKAGARATGDGWWLAGALAILALTAGCTDTDDAVLVFGGTGRSGVEIVRELRAAGAAVTVFARPTSDRSAIESYGVDFVVGDAMQPADVDRAFAHGDFDAVVSTIGRRRGEPRPDYVANANVIRSAVRAGVPRMILISSMGAGNSREYVPDLPEFMFEVLEAKTAAEDELVASGLGFTIIRPGRLLDGPATGRALLSEDVSIVNRSINRADLGALTRRVWADASTVGAILHAWDPSLDRPGE